METLIPQTALLETGRLFLKEMTPEWLSYALTNFSDAELMKLFGFSTVEELALEKQKFSAGITTFSISFRNFLMQLKTTGETIGRIGFHTWQVRHFRAEIGYAITNNIYKNQGYMTEAMKAVIDYGFTTMGLERIEACVGPGNTPSIKLVEKFGFSREGYFRNHYYKDNVLYDSISFALLKQDYLNTNSDMPV